VRLLARLAAAAPAQHLADFVDLAHATFHDELDLHRGLAASFGAQLETARKGPACERYTAFLLAAAEDYGTVLAALLPCMRGYAELGRRLAQAPPDEPRFRRWVEAYADPDFAALAGRGAEMLDETPVDETQASAIFHEAMGHELAFWSIPESLGGAGRCRSVT
jgi:thiaminase/transcriptional activator TenA